jgi:hypothetical protein
LRIHLLLKVSDADCANDSKGEQKLLYCAISDDIQLSSGKSPLPLSCSLGGVFQHKFLKNSSMELLMHRFSLFAGA